MPLPELEWRLEDYARVLRLHRWLVGSAVAVFGMMTALYALEQPNVYQATARILIEPQAPQVVQFREMVSWAGFTLQSFLQTEYQIMTSPQVMERVVEELSLASSPPFSKSADPASLLLSGLKVDLIRGTKLVDIAYTSTKPELAAKVANAVANTYAKYNLERRQEMTTGGISWLKDEVVKAEQKMKAAQLALQQFKEQHRNLPVGKEDQNTVLQRLEQLNTAITEAKKQRIEAETKYRAKHPVLMELQAKERELELALQEQEKLVLEMNRLAIESDNLQRDAQTSESIHSALSSRLKELFVQEGFQTNNVRVVNYAKVPKNPIGPRRFRSILFAMIIGFFLGSALAVAREVLSKTIRSRLEFEQTLEIPFLGHVPLIRVAKEHRGNESLVLLADPKSVAAEAIRAVRTTLEFLLPPGQPQVLLITSSLPEEGKSLISLNLAFALQELDRKVLLVDADLRRPTLHRLLQLNLEPGLSTYLQDQAVAEELVQTATVAKDLPVVTAGPTPSQPTDLLTSQKLPQLLAVWRKEYRYILIDTPPVLAVADAAALSGIAEGVLYILRADRTHREIALAGKQRLIDVGAKLIGGVLNGSRPEIERGYHHYYYYYGGKGQRPGRPGQEPLPPVRS